MIRLIPRNSERFAGREQQRATPGEDTASCIILAQRTGGPAADSVAPIRIPGTIGSPILRNLPDGRFGSIVFTCTKQDGVEFPIIRRRLPAHRSYELFPSRASACFFHLAPRCSSIPLTKFSHVDADPRAFVFARERLDPVFLAPDACLSHETLREILSSRVCLMQSSGRGEGNDGSSDRVSLMFLAAVFRDSGVEICEFEYDVVSNVRSLEIEY